MEDFTMTSILLEDKSIESFEKALHQLQKDFQAIILSYNDVLKISDVG